jgi:hypothetical protein
VRNRRGVSIYAPRPISGVIHVLVMGARVTGFAVTIYHSIWHGGHHISLDAPLGGYEMHQFPKRWPYSMESMVIVNRSCNTCTAPCGLPPAHKNKPHVVAFRGAGKAALKGRRRETDNRPSLACASLPTPSRHRALEKALYKVNSLDKNYPHLLVYFHTIYHPTKYLLPRPRQVDSPPVTSFVQRPAIVSSERPYRYVVRFFDFFILHTAALRPWHGYTTPRFLAVTS